MDARAAEVLLFAHLPKTAGTTLRALIRAQEPGRVVELDSGVAVDAFLGAPQAERDAADVVLGHVQVGLHRVLTRPARYLTVLRDPVARVVSDHAFARGPDHPQRHVARAVDVATWAEEHRPDNGMVRLLSSHGLDGVGPAGQRHLAEAREVLDDLCAVVGVAEDFVDVVVRLSLWRGWPATTWTDRNVTGRHRADRLAPALRARVEARSALDRRLHEHALVVAARQAQVLGDDYLRRRAEVERRSGGTDALRRRAVTAAARTRRAVRRVRR